MNETIIDGMKKEGKPYRNVMIFGYVFSILMPISLYFADTGRFSNRDIILIAVAFILIGTIGLYGWLYAIKYKVEFDSEKLYLKTLFKKVEISICDINNYSCHRYRKSVFYQFTLFIKDKKVLINTRYRDEFEKVLQNRGSQQHL